MSKKAFTIAAILGGFIASHALYAGLHDRKRSREDADETTKIPIVFHKDYDFKNLPQEVEDANLFVRKKYSRIVENLVASGLVDRASLAKPSYSKISDFKSVQNRGYLARVEGDPEFVFGIFDLDDSLKNNDYQAFLEKGAHGNADRLRNAQLLGSGGTLMASKLAQNHPEKWAINLSGGYHHAKKNTAAGYCLFADGALALQRYLRTHPTERALIIDLDAHHGDGNASIFEGNPKVGIFDIYNQDVFPLRKEKGQPKPVSPQSDEEKLRFYFPTPKGTGDDEYLTLLKDNLDRAIDKVKPGIIFYNAGTDIYEDDPIGELNISLAGIIERDEFVFRKARERKIPIFMALSGGYADNFPEIVSDSIINLIKKGIILQAPEQSPQDSTLPQEPKIKRPKTAR